MKYESVIKTDDENPCELQCVGSTRQMGWTKYRQGPAARLVRDAEVELAPSLTYLLLNRSQVELTVPALLKSARVISLYKSGPGCSKAG